MSRPNADTVTAWVRLLKAHRIASGGVEAALKNAGFPPLAWYDALLELKRARKGLRLQDLEARMLLPQYNLSRLSDRLEGAGYLIKTIDPADGRSRVLTITKEGRALLKAMWPVYARAIHTFVGDRISRSDAAQLSTLLDRVAGERK